MYRWFEHFFILPLRWYRQHIYTWREGRQRCKHCGQADGLNFSVPDQIWSVVVPAHLRERVVCLRCFDRFAKAKKVDYATFLQELWFAGDKGTLSFEITAAISGKSD